MFVILLKFSDNKDNAKTHMAGHIDWLNRGFAEQGFLAAGGLQPAAGGGILAHGTDRDALEAFVQEDPFVAHNVVVAEMLEITPTKTDPRLEFLTTPPSPAA